MNHSNYPSFEKQIKIDNAHPGINKKDIRVIEDVKICVINGEFLRDPPPNGLGFNGFVDGGSSYVTSLPGYKKFIPEDEIWIDDVFLSKPNDMEAIILHERIERHLMKFHKVPYETAHSQYAEKAEKLYRKLCPSGVHLDISQKIFDKYLNEYTNKKHKKNLKEEFQFNKIKGLMNL